MSDRSGRIKRINFFNFKAFKNYSLTLSDVNIIVGPNNSGKSTIIGALRTLDSSIRFARTRSPIRLELGENTVIGYRIPRDSVPISLECAK
jgi:AAA15 family ATPase/GTPase